MLQNPLNWAQGHPPPTVAQLRRGVLLRTIVEVVSTQPGGAPSDTFLWRGESLELLDYNETIGCVAFAPERIVGAFYYFESERNPLAADEFPPYDAACYFAAAPPDVWEIARQAVLPQLVTWIGDPALADRAFEQGTVNELDAEKFVPVITSAFWSEVEQLTGGELWPEIYRHGAHILWREFSDPDSVLDYFARQESIASERLALALRLYERRLATTGSTMLLTAREYADLMAFGVPQSELVRAQLTAVGITLP